MKDLALVSDLRLELSSGLTVLTGETGAGKSMLVDALLAVTGGRRHHQVMVVSHLPQVATYADQHIRVRKEVRKGRTHVVAERLDESESVDELAEMLGAGGARSLAAGARELRASANTWRKAKR